MARYREDLAWAFDSGQLREGAKSTGGIGGCPSPNLGTSPQRRSCFLCLMAASPSKAGPEAQGSGVIATPPLKNLNPELLLRCSSTVILLPSLWRKTIPYLRSAFALSGKRIPAGPSLPMPHQA